MASTNRKVDLYLAVSFKDLKKIAKTGRMHLDKENAHASLVLANKLWTEYVESAFQGDEELAYCSLYRCVKAITSAKIKKDYPKYENAYQHLLPDHTFEMRLITYRNNLERRYAARTNGQAVDQYPVATVTTPTASVKSFALKICKTKIAKLPLHIYRFLGGKQTSLEGASDLPRITKIIIVDVDPQPADGSEEAVKFCKCLKQKTLGEDGGGSVLSFSIEVTSFDMESKVAGMIIRVDGPFIMKLVEGFDMEGNQSLKMNLSMKLYAKDIDLHFKDAHVKLFKRKGREPLYFGIYVGLKVLDEWMDDTSQPKAKITLQLIQNVNMEPAATSGPLKSTSHSHQLFPQSVM